MTEFSTEQVKDCQLLNVSFTLNSLLETTGEGLRHVGDHLYRSATDDNVSEEDEKEFKHLLKGLSKVMESLTKAIQINNVAEELVKKSVENLSEEDKISLRNQVSETQPIADMVSIMRETAEETLVRLLAKALQESTGFGLNQEELDMLSGK